MKALGQAETIGGTGAAYGLNTQAYITDISGVSGNIAYGVYSIAEPVQTSGGTATGYGVYGQSYAGSAGVMTYGIYGLDQAGNYAVYGSEALGNGSGYGGYFTNTSTGAGFGLYATETGASNTGYAGYFNNASASGWAGYFNGEVNVSGNLTVSSCTGCVAAGSNSLSSLTSATTTNSIDNANWAQVWKWGTLSTQTALNLTTSSMTTGTLLNLTDNSTSGSAGTVLNISSNQTGAGSGINVSSATTGSRLRHLHRAHHDRVNTGYGVHCRPTPRQRPAMRDISAMEAASATASMLSGPRSQAGLKHRFFTLGAPAGSGAAIYALESSTSNTAAAIYAQNNSAGGTAIVGYDGNSAGGVGVFGQGASAGVFGYSNTDSTYASAVYAEQQASSSFNAVYGVNAQVTNNTNNGSAAVFAQIGTGLGNGAGVYANTISRGSGYGVYGSVTSSGNTGYGGYFTDTHGTGVNYGLYASTSSGTGYAGYFQGAVNVNGVLTVSKLRRLQHGRDYQSWERHDGRIRKYRASRHRVSIRRAPTRLRLRAMASKLCSGKRCRAGPTISTSHRARAAAARTSI